MELSARLRDVRRDVRGKRDRGYGENEDVRNACFLLEVVDELIEEIEKLGGATKRWTQNDWHR
jgi:hypothetical protein